DLKSVLLLPPDPGCTIFPNKIPRKTRQIISNRTSISPLHLSRDDSWSWSSTTKDDFERQAFKEELQQEEEQHEKLDNSTIASSSPVPAVVVMEKNRYLAGNNYRLHHWNGRRSIFRDVIKF